MKQFACGDVVPGCDVRWVCSTDEEVLARVANHVRQDHGVIDFPAAIVEQVRARIRTVA